MPPTQKQLDRTNDSLGKLRLNALLINSRASAMRGQYEHKDYSRAHLRKVIALSNEILSELDFVEFAFKEER